MSDVTDDLTQYLPSWQVEPPLAPAPDTPSTMPVYGQMQPIIDPEQSAQAAAPPPMTPGSPSPTGNNTIPNVIFTFNGTAYYCTLSGTIGAAV